MEERARTAVKPQKRSDVPATKKGAIGFAAEMLAIVPRGDGKLLKLFHRNEIWDVPTGAGNFLPSNDGILGLDVESGVRGSFCRWDELSWSELLFQIVSSAKPAERWRNPGRYIELSSSSSRFNAVSFCLSISQLCQFIHQVYVS